MRKLRYAYFVTLADKSQHRVVTDRCNDYYTAECFRRQLEQTMKDEGAVEESRIAIRNFWYHGEVDPEDLIFSHAGRAGAENPNRPQPGRQ